LKSKKKNFYLNLLIFIGAPVLIAAGVLTVKLSQNNRIIALGGLLICFGAFFLLMGLLRVASLHSIKKQNAQQELASKQEREKQLNDALKEFLNKTDYPEPNTVKAVNAGFEFFAEGRYVCEKDFKNIPGYHFAFEISSTRLKHKPDGCDDGCYLEENGVLIAAGYHDGEALEKYANDNGIVLQDTVEKLVGQVLTLKPDDGYNFYIFTAEGDEINYGFVKILKCDNDVLTVYFMLDVPFGLDDTVEGTIELKKDVYNETQDIHSLINRIKRKRYNTIEVTAEEAQAIKNANPFLPESYIVFLSEVGFADLDWIDVGWNNKTPTNLDDDETKYVNDILADYDGMRSDDFYFIGLDNGGSYYALSRNPNDGKVYVFSDDASDIATYENFEEFLNEILSV